MNIPLYINLLIQFLIGLGLNLICQDAMGYSDENPGFIIGRAFGGTLFPLAINAAIAGSYKLVTKKKMPLFYLTLWILWALIAYMSTQGAIMHTTEQNLMDYR